MKKIVVKTVTAASAKLRSSQCYANASMWRHRPSYEPALFFGLQENADALSEPVP